MYKQADFASAWMPAGTHIGPDEDVDFFVLTDDESLPVVVGGDTVVQFHDDGDDGVGAQQVALARPDRCGARPGQVLHEEVDPRRTNTSIGVMRHPARSAILRRQTMCGCGRGSRDHHSATRYCLPIPGNPQ